MEILVVTDLYPISESEKNTPKTIYNFVKSWEKAGHNVKVIKPNFILNSFIREKPFYKSGIYKNVENINYWMPFLGNIRQKIQTNLDADIVISHMPSGLIVSNKLGLDFTAGVHISDLEVLTNPIYSMYFKTELLKAYQNSKKIACRSDVIYKKFLKLFPQYEEKTFVAFSGIDEKLITKRNWVKKNKYKVLTCANLIKRKNIDKLIQACNGLKNIELTVIGDGKEMNNLQKISSDVIFTGRLEHSDVIKIMRKSDIFILPSKNETFGMVYLEAMASGCITVCLEDDGIDGIIKDEVNGFTCTTKNVQNTILKIINSAKNDEILANSYNTILNYTEEKAAQNYLSNIFNEE